MTKEENRFNEVLNTMLKKGDAFVDCSSLKLNDVQLEQLIDSLETSPSSIAVKSINLSRNMITSAGVYRLVHYLANHIVE